MTTIGDAKKLRLLHLYPEHMNLYGDRGNVLALSQRARWRGIDVEVVPYDGGNENRWTEVDLVFMGGGEDTHQVRIAEDFLARSADLLSLLEDGVPMLAVCGAFQLMGTYYRTSDGRQLPGVGYFDVTTEPGRDRAIGDVVLDCSLPIEPDTIVGFENHGGRTFLGPGVKPLGVVKLGQGNNGEDKTEGAVKGHVIGTYLHGSLLPKNPHLTDLLLTWALARHGQEDLVTPLSMEEEIRAHGTILGRA